MVDPMYLQIADDLRQQIEDGELSPGDQLPTEVELREHYKTSRNTIRGAVQELLSRDLVTTQPGRGTFVKGRIKLNVNLSSLSGPGGGEGESLMFDAQVQGRETDASEPRVEIQRASTEIARELMINRGDQVVSRHQQRLVDGEPWSLQTSFYPMAFVLEGATDLLQATNIPGGAVKYLENTLGSAHRQAGYQDKITVRPPDQTETTFFRLPARGGGTPVIVTKRTGFDSKGRPIRHTVTIYPSDRNQLYFNVGTVPGPLRVIENPEAIGADVSQVTQHTPDQQAAEQ